MYCASKGLLTIYVYHIYSLVGWVGWGVGELCYEKKWCVGMRALGTDQSGGEAYIYAESLAYVLVLVSRRFWYQARILRSGFNSHAIQLFHNTVVVHSLGSSFHISCIIVHLTIC